MEKERGQGMPKIILASTSPRRRELLGQIGLPFEVRTGSAEEKSDAAEPWSMVEELSWMKAQASFDMLGDDVSGDVLVVGADTVVASGRRILGKPAHSAEAFEMLRGLAGRMHEVYTGVTLLYGHVRGRSGAAPLRKTFHEVTKVSLYPMSETEIRRYLSTGDCMDKAGGYGIQGFFARYVRGIEGDYNNVVGLPVGRLYQEAKEWLGE